MANIFNQVMNAGKSTIPDEPQIVPTPGSPHNPDNPEPEPLPDASCEVIADPEIKSDVRDTVIIPFPCTFAAERLKWSSIKGRFKKVDFNPDLRAWMFEDSRVYNWIWTSLAVIVTNHDINADFPVPRDLEIMIPIPDDFREMFGVEPGRCIIVTRKDQNVLSVAV